MKRISGIVIGLSLALTACKPAAKSESETSGIRDWFGGGSDSYKFNLATHLQSKGSRLGSYVKNGDLMLGDKSTLGVSNNFTVEGSKSAGKIQAQYYLRGHALKAEIPVFDAVVAGQQRPASGSYSIRALGQVVKQGSLSSAIDFRTVRDYTIAIPDYSLSAVGFYGKAGVGGEIALKGSPALDPARGSIQLRLSPSAALFSKLELGASVLKIATAGIQGTVKMFDVEENVYAELGVNAKKETFGIFKANALEINAMGGKLEAVATLGVNNLLPAPMQSLWKKYLEKKWVWPVLTIPSMQAVAIQGTELSFGNP